MTRMVRTPAGARDERVALADGITLRILRWEPGSSVASVPFILVHGLASNARVWDGVGRRLAAAGHEAVAVDQRGHGLSDKPDSGYDFATVATDLRDLIAALRLDRPILVGQSWGADVVVETAIRNPEVVRGVALIDGHLTDLRDGFASWEECWARLTPPPSVGLPKEKIERWFAVQHPDWPAEGLEGSLGNFEVREDGTVAPWLSLEHHREIVRSMWDQRVGESWALLHVPVLILPVDGNDQLRTEAKRAGAEAAEQALARAGTPVRVQWFMGDHDIHVQRPGELAATLLQAAGDGFLA
jgi:pimeloyl-ACP methyl ester carboxylesterase